ncbi:SDR family oxidoreductase [Vulgatibacter incomptus]|nr:NAD(P)H-binding protein [Vulgatibacter incomptus]
MRTAFVAGATGYTGREVVRQLRQQGVRTIAHVRPGSRASGWADAFRRWGAEVAEVAWEPEALRGAIEVARPDAVFSLIGTTRARAKREALQEADIYDAVDYRLHAMLVDAVSATCPGARLVYLSSMGADASSRNPYLAARGRAERKLVESGLPWTIARPSFISGPDRDRPRRMERVSAVVADRLLGVAGIFGAAGLRERYRSIDNVALASALIAAALNPAFAGETLPGEALQRLAAGQA